MHEMNAFPLSRNIIISAKVVFLGETDHFLLFFFTSNANILLRFSYCFPSVFVSVWHYRKKALAFQCKANAFPVQCRRHSSAMPSSFQCNAETPKISLLFGVCDHSDLKDFKDVGFADYAYRFSAVFCHSGGGRAQGPPLHVVC